LARMFFISCWVWVIAVFGRIGCRPMASDASRPSPRGRTAVCLHDSMGNQFTIAVSSRWTAGIDERSIHGRLQRNEINGQHLEHDSHRRSDAGLPVLGCGHRNLLVESCRCFLGRSTPDHALCKRAPGRFAERCDGGRGYCLLRGEIHLRLLAAGDGNSTGCNRRQCCDRPRRDVDSTPDLPEPS